MAKNESENPVTIATDTPSTVKMESLIHLVRDVPVMIDRDLAKLYGVDVSQLNRQVKRNIDRFPSDFMFQLTKKEYENLICQFGISNWGGNRYMPYAFTEQGVAMLSGVLRSSSAITVNIQIMRAFVSMRHLMASNIQMLQRITDIEQHQIDADRRITETDQRIDEVFRLLDQGVKAKQGVFCDGQIFDAYLFVSNLVKSANNRIVLIDNYIDESVLTLFDKRKVGVNATIFTRQLTPQLQLDLNRHNAQYAPITIDEYTRAHDRFLLIDNDVYHIGASLKDLGKRLFAFSRMEATSADDMLSLIAATK